MILREVYNEYIDIISSADLKKKIHAGKVCRSPFLGGMGVTMFHLDVLMCQKIWLIKHIPFMQDKTNDHHFGHLGHFGEPGEIIKKLLFYSSASFETWKYQNFACYVFEMVYFCSLLLISSRSRHKIIKHCCT